MQSGARDTCPISVGHKMIPTEHKGVDAHVFDESLESWGLGRSIGFLPKEMQRTGVRSQRVGTLQVSTDASDGIVPDGVRACNLYGMQRTDAAQDVKKDEEVATENHLLVKKCL